MSGLQVVANQQFVKAPVKVDGLRFINCDFQDVFITWDGGPYSFENCRIDPSRVSGFQTGNPAIAEQLRFLGMLGLLHPRGTRAMGIPLDPEDELLFLKAESTLVSGIRLSRVEDVTSRWGVSFRADRAIPRLQVCLDLQLYMPTTGGSASWQGRARHSIAIKDTVAKGQTFYISIVEDGPSPFEAAAPHWVISPPTSTESGLVEAPPAFTRGQIVFISGEQEQTFKFVAMPRDLNETIFLVGEDMFDFDRFWSLDATPPDLRLSRGRRQLLTSAAGRPR